MRSILGRIRRKIVRDPNRFLRSASGVIHVGANVGQERETYEELGLDVLWIEPIPAVFEELKSNIAHLPRQRAIQALITNKDDEDYQFNIANNKGASSSILELKDHKDIWPEVKYTDKISLVSSTLPSILQKENIDPEEFDALIMDTQGSELLVLEGAVPLLKYLKIIKTEVADFESYAGCCLLADVDRFMRQHGFIQCARHAFAQHRNGGKYYDITYKKLDQ